MNYTMKKILYAIPLLALLFASCDPKEIDLGSPDSAISENALAEGFSFSQWSDESHSTPQADGNYFTFTTNPVQPVIVYQLVDGKIMLSAQVHLVILRLFLKEDRLQSRYSM